MAEISKHILMICVSSQGVINFRRGLIKKLLQEGNKVSIVAFDDDFQNDVESLGCDFYCVNDNNRSTSPLKILTLKNKYFKLIKKIKPDIVFTFMLKPNIFGVLAAKKAKVNAIYSMVEGVGDVFINNGIKWNLIRQFVKFFYRMSFKNVRNVFFLNEDDAKDFISHKLVIPQQIVKINGIGVDLCRFEYQKLENKTNFLMIARLMKNKGVYEYCECARKVRRVYPNVVFEYLGAEGNISVDDIQSYIDDGSIKYLGVSKDVRPYLKSASIVVLPSYREGVPMSIMEAMSIGRAIITTNVPGCKETVIDNYNGFLIDKSHVDQLVERSIWFIKNPNEIERFGRNSRSLAEQKFNEKDINDQILSIIFEKIYLT